MGLAKTVLEFLDWASLNVPRLLLHIAIAGIIAESRVTAEEPANSPRIARRSPSEPLRSHPLDPALELAQSSLEHLQSNVHDYTALFVKRCRVDGTLPPLQFARLKMRNRKIERGQIITPMSVYLDFLKPQSVKGREVIWVEGENNGDLIVHQGGLASFITVQIDPDGALAMRGQRYSIREIGIENLLHQFIETGLRDRQYDECEVTLDHNVKLGDQPCSLVEIVHPIARDHFRFHRARVYFDRQTQLPIRYQAWMWPQTPGGDARLDEEYNYFKLQVNVGLSASDFDPDNPEYRFR